MDLRKLCTKLAPQTEDCRELVSTARDLFMLMFPKTATTEQPPCTMREACESFWTMLISVGKDLSPDKQTNAFHKAWSRYTWNSSDSFDQFLDPELHNNLTSAESDWTARSTPRS